MRYKFSAADRWAVKMKGRLHYMKVMVPARIMQAQQRQVSRGGRMPVLTGELRDSLVIQAGSTLLIGEESFRELINLPPFKGNIEWGWTVPYANRINYGFTGYDSIGRYYNQKGVHFIEYGQGLARRITRDEAKRAMTIK